MPRRFLGLFARVAMLASLLSCNQVSSTQSQLDSGSSRGSQGESTAASALMVLPEATKVVPSKDYYDGTVQYQLDEPYPAKNAIAFINTELTKQGWAPLTLDFLNPDSQTSHVTGWNGGVIVGKETVYSWMGQWQNTNGDIVLYRLSYRVPTAAVEASGPLYVQAVFFSKATAERLKKQERP